MAFIDKQDMSTINGKLCISPAGTVKLIAYSAYREFDRSARDKNTKVLNLILSVAKERGYDDEAAFRSYFGSAETDYAHGTSLAEKILEFVPPLELAKLMEGVV